MTKKANLNPNDVAADDALAVKLAAKHAPHLLEVQRKRREANAKIDHQELRYFGEFADEFFGDRETFGSKDPKKNRPLGQYVKRLQTAGIEIDRQAARRRIIAYFVNEQLRDADCSALNKLSQSQLNALDGVEEPHLSTLAEAAVEEGLSSRVLVELVSNLPDNGADPEDEPSIEVKWSASRVARRITTIARRFEKEFKDAPPSVRKDAIDGLLARLSCGEAQETE